MMQLETFIELKFVNSSFPSSNLSVRAFRACPLIESKQTSPFSKTEPHFHTDPSNSEELAQGSKEGRCIMSPQVTWRLRVSQGCFPTLEISFKALEES
jgi:hypothetical protein